MNRFKYNAIEPIQAVIAESKNFKEDIGYDIGYDQKAKYKNPKNFFHSITTLAFWIVKFPSLKIRIKAFLM